MSGPAGADVRPVVLVVDDDPGLRESFRLILDEAFQVREAATGREGLDALREGPVDVMLLDVRLPDMNGIDVLAEARAVDDQVDVILVTAVQTLRTAVSAMKLGAFDYVTKPFEEEEILATLRKVMEKRALGREVQYLRSELASRADLEALVGQHPSLETLRQLIATLARTPVTVLITGESGTGKELVARAIHRQGARGGGPFVPVNVAAISEALLESELFGHERGAFTGATGKKLGKFELAQGGTLFLDEIATLRVELQAKLLRVLQEREIERVGGLRRIRLDARVIAATNTDLRRAVLAGSFREDLYFRLNVVQVAVPPLRDRRSDIPLLAEHFLRKYGQRFHKRIGGLSDEALAVLAAYWWPGNVRELENVIERAVALGDGPLVETSHLPLDLMIPSLEERGDGALSLKDAREQFERELVLRVLRRVQGNQTEAARLLGVHRNSIKAKLAAWGVDALE